MVVFLFTLAHGTIATFFRGFSTSLLSMTEKSANLYYCETGELSHICTLAFHYCLITELQCVPTTVIDR